MDIDRERRILRLFEEAALTRTPNASSPTSTHSPPRDAKRPATDHAMRLASVECRSIHLLAFGL